MEIEFSVEEADLLAYFEYHNEHSESSQRTRRRQTYGYGFGFMGLGIVLIATVSTGMGVAFLISGVGWMVFWPREARRRYQKQVAALWREGRNPMFEGAQTLRLDDANLVSVSAAGEGRMPLNIVQRVVTTPDLLLIYMGSIQAIIIPRRRVVKGDIDKFEEELRRRVGAA